MRKETQGQIHSKDLNPRHLQHEQFHIPVKLSSFSTFQSKSILITQKFPLKIFTKIPFKKFPSLAH